MGRTNSRVRCGPIRIGIVWAFTTIDYFYWQRTLLSHMLDCQIFGVTPAGPHVVNILLHILNSILVFLIFRRLTNAFWRSAILAALFALHRLRPESVVWIANPGAQHYLGAGIDDLDRYAVST